MCVCVCGVWVGVCARTHTHARMHACTPYTIWRSDYHLWKSVLYVHPMGPKDGSQVIRFGSKELYPMNHLPGLLCIFLEKQII